MPRSTDQDARRQLFVGAGEAWGMVGELLTATGVWAAIGYGADRLFGTWPILFVIGAVAGHATGIYILMMRQKWASARAQAQRRF
jgi:F0F1-type ATP synthase assembly protein I